jgi:LuxR family maltose regulon positive regulatory protein
MRGTADMHVGMGEYTASATTCMPPRRTCSEARSRASTPGSRSTRIRWRVAMARILEARGDLDGALDLLDEAGAPVL